MAIKEIRCKDCNKYCGEIRDAKLIKGLTFVCDECSNKRKLKENYDKYNSGEKMSASDIFGGLFK